MHPCKWYLCKERGKWVWRNKYWVSRIVHYYRSNCVLSCSFYDVIAQIPDPDVFNPPDACLWSTWRTIKQLPLAVVLWYVINFNGICVSTCKLVVKSRVVTCVHIYWNGGFGGGIKPGERFIVTRCHWREYRIRANGQCCVGCKRRQKMYLSTGHLRYTD